ncbi:MAG TPA: hypothetical protein VGL76_06605 [Gaiellaceae bacterium]|jgi:hypothetical protein
MRWVHGHVAAIGVVAVALFATAGVFAFARPEFHQYVMPSPPPEPLPYAKVTYSATDAQRAFRGVDINLVLHTHEPVPVGAPPIIDLSNNGNVVVVDVFGDPQRVAASGFSDYFNFANGHWLKAPKTCSSTANGAERWHGNVRVIVSCARAGTSAGVWLRRVDQAFAQLAVSR